MLLTKGDIARLVNKGFMESSFVKVDKLGYAQLKNRHGYCVFYDVGKRQCGVYVDRPSGCRVYPVILDEDKGIVLDHICESRTTVSMQEKNHKGKRVIKLLAKIDSEAAARRY